MKMLQKIFPLLCLLMVSTLVSSAQSAMDDQNNQWPVVINANDGSVIKIYEPEPESLSGNVLKSRSAISILQTGASEPIFGTFWAVQTVDIDRDNRQIHIISAKVPNIRFADNIDANTTNSVKALLESQIPSVEPALSQETVLASLANNNESKNLSKDLQNNPPKIIYANRPSLLVTIDGEPRLQKNSDWNLDAVVNSPFTIVKNGDGMYYLYGGKHWYQGQSASGQFTYTPNVPYNLNKVKTSIDNANNSDPGYTSIDSAYSKTNTIPEVIVSTVPAELIETDGNPSFTNIDGTDLAYVSNSQNDIFLSKDDQLYYILLSGRWYKSANLNTGWSYVDPNNLPGDFAKIPEGSPKDNVLASVAGTNASREAVMDAQIPQTAKVDRKSATTTVNYDGDPNFQPIDGTDMTYATNTPNSVIYSHGIYYCVDKGVWFQSYSPSGPWSVSTTRPDQEDMIPPTCPLYNTKYVYIYDVDPDYAYMGYTPGYLNTFIYGPTVVYGTGYYYRPWIGRHFYARPYTWGFGMYYNPWAGFSMGYLYGDFWFNFGFGLDLWPGWCGGWWGPNIYRPPFRLNAFRPYGFYGHNRNGFAARPGGGLHGNHFSNNIYNYRRDVVTSNRVYNQANRPAMNNRQGNVNRPAINNNANNRQSAVNRPANNIQTDRAGNVYQRNSTTQQWQQRTQSTWRPAASNTTNNLNRQQQTRQRGAQRQQNFQNFRQGSVSRPASGGGGNRGGGGGGGNRGGGGRH